VASLVSKPGLTNASALAIPTQWSAQWFKGFISNLLQGADVRNAVGSGGIVVSGNIASPYATIGFAAPIILPGPVTINGSNGAAALTVIAGTGQTAIIAQGTGGNTTFTGNVKFGAIQMTGSSGGSDFEAIDFINSAGNVTGRIGLQSAVSGSFLNFGTSNNYANGITQVSFQLSNTLGVPGVKGYGPNAAGLVDMTPDTGTYTGTLVGCTTSPTATVVWARVGNLVIIYVPALSATSNSTGLSITGSLPAALQPARSQVMAVPASAVTDGGAKVNDVSVSMGAGSSTITFLRGDSSSGFTNSATTKGVTRNLTFAYLLN
jgi:hypothetical protein